MGTAADEIIARAKAWAAAKAATSKTPGNPLARDFDGPPRPDPVGPGQILLRRLDAEREEEHQRGMERERQQFYRQRVRYRTYE